MLKDIVLNENDLKLLRTIAKDVVSAVDCAYDAEEREWERKWHNATKEQLGIAALENAVSCGS